MSASGTSRVITEPLGGSPLSLAIQTRGLPHSLQPWSPSSIEEWREHAAAVRRGVSPSWYGQLGAAFGADVSEVAAARMNRVVAEQGIVVTTGQQAALFGGPLYNIAKAFTALALADEIEQRTGVPTAPVFWAATDDADFIEASATWVADADGLRELRLEEKPAPGTPMADAALGDIRALIEQLRRACGSAAYAEYFELVAEAFAKEGTLGAAYVRMFRDLLGPLGISVMDSSHPAYRNAARPLLLEAVVRAPAIAEAVARRSSALRELGFEPQVEDERGLSLVAILEEGIKRRIPIDEDGLLERRGESAVLAPNVLLRPVIERAILPTVAYVGGPAELAYFTQSIAVADALSVSAPVAVPRWSCTIIEPFADRALRRLGVEYRQLKDRAVLEHRLAKAALPDPVAAAWTKVQDQLRSSIRELGDAVKETSLMPPAVVQGLENSLLHKLGRGERRLLAAVKRREERVRHDVEVASAALFPFGKRQERVLNFVPMLTRGGPDLVADMQRAAGEHATALVGVERRQPVAAR